jgi:hypothetical protein
VQDRIRRLEDLASDADERIRALFDMHDAHQNDARLQGAQQSADTAGDLANVDQTTLPGLDSLLGAQNVDTAKDESIVQGHEPEKVKQMEDLRHIVEELRVTKGKLETENNQLRLRLKEEEARSATWQHKLAMLEESKAACVKLLEHTLTHDLARESERVGDVARLQVSKEQLEKEKEVLADEIAALRTQTQVKDELIKQLEDMAAASQTPPTRLLTYPVVLCRVEQPLVMTAARHDAIMVLLGSIEDGIKAACASDAADVAGSVFSYSVKPALSALENMLNRMSNCRDKTESRYYHDFKSLQYQIESRSISTVSRRLNEEYAEQELCIENAMKDFAQLVNGQLLTIFDKWLNRLPKVRAVV